MESSPHFSNSSDPQNELSSHLSVDYDFSQENLDDIPHPDDNSPPPRPNPLTMILSPNDSELPPLPPDILDDKPPLLSSSQLKNVTLPLCTATIFVPPEQIPLPESSSYQLDSILPPPFTPPLPRCIQNQEENYQSCEKKGNFSSANRNQDDRSQEIGFDANTFLDNAKYSPSKVESDEENQDFIAAKPKVLGKEQAKKRLMAFSLSKQPSTTAIKKQSKMVSLSKTVKEKPPNPNKGSGVQEQFRATISEIEEEKKKMMQNMPNYLLLEMSDLARSSHPIMPSSLKLLEKYKTEAADLSAKDIFKKEDSISNKSIEVHTQKNKESFKRSGYRSKSPNRSYGRRSRSPSKTRKHSRSRRSRGSSRRRKKSRTRSPAKNSKEDKSSKSKKDTDFSGTPESCSDWKSFKASSLIGGTESPKLKPNWEENKKKRNESNRRSLSPYNSRGVLKPTFNYLKKESKQITSFQAIPIDPKAEGPVLYLEKNIKFTRTKPMIVWSENPSYGTEFYMSKQMLLENCDSATASTLNSIIKSQKNYEEDEPQEKTTPRSRPWYSTSNFLLPAEYALYDDLKIDAPQNHEKAIHKNDQTTVESDMDEEGEKSKLIKKDDVNKDANKTEDLKFENKISWDRRGRSTPNSKRINLVNDSYLSDEEVDKTKMKEMVVGNVKVQLDLDLNSVKVRSRWDSDYEGENSEKEASYHKEVDMEIATPEEEGDTSSQGRKKSSPDNVNFNNQSTKVEQILEKKILETQNEFNINPLKDESENHVVSNELQGNLASEYEEFLKMVSFDSNSNQPVANKENTPETWSKLEKEKVSKVEKLTQEVQKPKFEMTDWDKESDHEEKAVGKIPFHKNEPNEEMLLLSEEKVPLKRRKSKKYIFLKKKSEKFTKKEKLPKKLSKNKKKKSEDSSSSDSSSDSYDSECDSDSDESKSCKRRKKRKKISKIKRKYRKDSSSSKSESASESDSDDSKFKKKKTKKRKDKKKKKSDSSDSDGNRQNALLKQLDYKKQLIMKKIEEIDSISERSSKKKSKDGKQKKKKDESFEEADSLEKYIKCIKRKKTELKTDKDKKKSKTSAKGGKNDKESKKKSTSSESDEETIMSKSRRKKEKFAEKKRRDTSESSDSDEKSIRSAKIQNKMSDFKNFKSVEIISKKIKKPKKEKRKNYSSSDSCSNDSFSIEQKKVKKRGGKNKSDDDNLEKEKILAENPSNIGGCSWKENFLLEDTFRIENTCLDVTDTKLEWKQPTAKTTEKIKEKGKESGDWEASSSLEESDQECKTRESWDDDIPFRNTKSEVSNAILEKSEVSKNSEKFDLPFSDIDSNGKRILGESEGVNQIFGSLKTSISNFSFNENSFCGFGQELSRDFFLTERTFSNSEVISEGKIVESCNIESRPFQSVAKASEINKPSKSELYSPGHSDSDVSDMENNIKTEKIASNSNTCSTTKEEVYDPLNSESETSLENAEVELSSIPLPRGSKILLPGEIINFNDEMSSKPQNFFTKSIELKTERSTIDLTSNLPIYTPPKPSFTSTDFSPLEISTSTAIGSLKEADKTAKKQVMSVKSQQKLQSKAASVFQDESDEEASDTIEKTKEANSSRNENLENSKSSIEENIDKNKIKESERRQSNYSRVKRKDYSKKRSKVVEESRERSRERSETRELKRKRSVSKERKSSSNSANDNLMISVSQTKNRSSETIYPISSKEKREIRSDSFEIEPLKSSTDLELVETVQPIPVLTGLGVTSLDRHSWNRSQLPGYSELSDVTGDLIDPSESFDIYPSDDLKFRNRHFDKVCIDRYEDSTDKSSSDKSAPKEEKKKIEKRHSRSKSLSPRKKRRSKTPDKRRSPRNRSPRRRSGSPKRRDKSPYSPRRRSPKRKSPSRRYRNSRSPDRRRKSRSRSPRKRRSSPLRRSRSLSPRKHRSPKRRDSPRRRNSSSRTFSPRESNSPRRENQFIHHYSNSFHNRIPVIGAAGDGVDHDLSPSKMRANSMGFPETVLNESEMNSSFYSREYQSEFMVSNYVEEVGGNNLITLRNPDMDKPTSPERLSLDQRIELELGVPLNSGNQGQNEQYDMPNPACKPFQDMNSVHFQNSYNCENNVNGDAFYQNQNMGVNSEFNNQYYNGHQPQTGYGPFQQYPNSQSVQSSMLQVGNIVEVVPTMQHPTLAPPVIPPKGTCHQIMQVGNVLQVVPSQKTAQSSPMPFSSMHNYGPPSSASPVPPVKTQKATAVVAPSSIVPTPNPEAVINPLIIAIQLEREKRKKEKEKRKLEREARRKARQLRREAKLMSVNEKLKKSVQDEGLMLGQEVEDDELLDGLDLPSPPIPVEIITVSSPNTLPPAGKGILITAGFMPKPPSEKKEVKFADGVCPGEGTSTSEGEDIASPPPKPKLPKEKRYKKKKTKVKKKVKVQIIRQIIQDEDDDEDDLSPPPPPPGDPPPVYFARFPFAGDAQFPVYQTQTTTTTLTTVQYQAQTF